MTKPDETVLKPEYEAQLCEYQKNRMNQLYQEFVDLNNAKGIRYIRYCPKCGIENPATTKGGKANSGKLMLKCCSCGKRFVYDTGSLTFYSHQDSGKWADFIKATMSGASIDECAALLDVHPATSFRMRHKLMSFLSDAVNEDFENKPLSNEVEYDETYYHESHKGLKDRELAEIEDEIYWNEQAVCSPDISTDKAVDKIALLEEKRKNILEKLHEKKRGISSDLACVITGVERQGDAAIKATNMAKPSSDDIRKATAVMENGSFVFIDGATAYLSVLEEKNCNYSVCPSSEEYDSVNHLNNVNSLHSTMAEWMRKYRGVSTIYLNRYASLFHFIHKYRSCDLQGMALLILKRLSNIQHYFYVHMMHTEEIFDDPQVMENRKAKLSIWEQYRNRKGLCRDRHDILSFA